MFRYLTLCLGMSVLLSGCGKPKETEPLTDRTLDEMEADWAGRGPHRIDGLPPISDTSAPADPWQAMINGKTVRQWYETAVDKQGDRLRRPAAIEELANAGGAGQVALHELLFVSDEETLLEEGTFSQASRSMSPGYVRFHTAQAIAFAGEKQREMAGDLTMVLKNDPEMRVRSTAAVALGSIGATDTASLDALFAVLSGEDYHVWPAAVAALCKVGRDDARTRPTFERIAAINPGSLRLPNNQDISVVNAKVEAGRCLSMW